MIIDGRRLIPLSLVALFLTACGGSESPGVNAPSVPTASVPPCGIEGSGVHIQDCSSELRVTGSMTTARANHTATLLQDGKVLIAGGFSAAGPSLASAELYDPSTGTFTATGDMIAARGAHTAELLANGKVLIAGGLTGFTGGGVNSAELYDPSTGAFIATGSMLTNCCWAGTISSPLPDGRVFIATEGNAEIYDPASGSFTLTGAYNTSVYAIYAATLLADGRILFAASWNSSSNDETDELFDPKTNTFSPTGTRINATIPSTATLLTNGTVLFVEGIDPAATSNNVEIYDPASGTFTVIGSTLYDQSGGTATRLDDGRVLIAGAELSQGISGISVGSPAVELYVPATGAFVSAASLSTGRFGHTATLLTDGTVLIAGGNTRFSGRYPTTPRRSRLTALRFMRTKPISAPEN